MKFLLFFSLFLTSTVYATDISGIWKQIDDKTGSSKAMIKITKDQNNIYTGTILKITPRSGYTPQPICVKCPAPYTNQPILG